MLLEILFLLDFCTFCNLMWLLPLLLISWLLGWLYEWIKRQKYITRIEELESDYRRHTAKITTLEKEITGINYELEKRTNEYNQARSNSADLDIQLRSCNEQRTNLEAQLNAFKEEDSVDVERGNSIIDDSMGFYKGGAMKDKLKEPGIQEESISENKDLIEDNPNEIVPQESENVWEIENNKQGIVSENIKITDEGELAQKDDRPDAIEAVQQEEELPVVPESIGFGAVFKSDDLKIIEGVGTKIEGLLKAAGYTTWAQVGEASADDLQKVLEEAGPRYRVHNPKTWPEQASLAASGDWGALINYQKFLDTGRDDTSAKGGTPSKIEKLYAKKIGLASFKHNDLKIVEGIGPKIAGLLNDAGIETWEALAKSSVSRIQAILNAAGDRYRLANPKTWPKQAQLAYEGKWPELKTYQDFLNGGRE